MTSQVQQSETVTMGPETERKRQRLVFAKRFWNPFWSSSGSV
jgi:hypothetical protein